MKCRGTLIGIGVPNPMKWGGGVEGDRLGQGLADTTGLIKRAHEIAQIEELLRATSRAIEATTVVVSSGDAISPGPASQAQLLARQNWLFQQFFMQKP